MRNIIEELQPVFREVFDDDTEETLSARVLEQEHKIYPRAIKLFVEGKLKIDGRHVKILE